VILDDALAAPNLFSEDDYLRCGPPRSLLCLPLLEAGKAGLGLLSWKTPDPRHAFTPDRDCSAGSCWRRKAAISLGESRPLYDLQQEKQRAQAR